MLNPSCLLVITPYKGHLGCVAGLYAWTNPLVMEYRKGVDEAISGFRKAREDDGGVKVASVGTQ